MRTKRAIVHDEFEENTDALTQKVTVTCIHCRDYKAAKNTTRQQSHLGQCRPYLEKMSEQGVENDITLGIVKTRVAPADRDSFGTYVCLVVAVTQTVHVIYI